MIDTLLSLSAAGGIGFIMYGTRKWLPKETPVPQMEMPPPEVAYLSNLSHLWTDSEVQISDASNLWLDQTRKNNTPIPRPSFNHSEIELFFSEMVEHRSSINGTRRELIIWLLTMLDTQGDCPSVVRNNKNEAEKLYSDDSYALLEKVPLYSHSLTVAHNFIGKTSHEALLADIILIALAHDIGKIPSYHDNMYSSGDHPIIAGLILNGIPQFMSLPNRNDILRAVTGHHLLKSDNVLTDGLKQSDYEARQFELGTLYAKLMTQKNKNHETSSNEQPAEEQKASLPDSPGTILQADEEREHPLGFVPAKEKYKPVIVDIPENFDPNSVIEVLKSWINMVESTSKGDKWKVVSMPNGVIYIEPDALWEAIKVASNYDSVMYASEGFESEKRNLMYSIVSELARTRNALATEYVAEGYYTSQVSIITGGGNRHTRLLVPLMAESFGVIPSELEALKSAQLKRMVKYINHKNKEVQQCVGS